MSARSKVEVESSHGVSPIFLSLTICHRSLAWVGRDLGLPEVALCACHGRFRLSPTPRSLLSCVEITNCDLKCEI